MILPTTLLKHHAPPAAAGPHYDWLIAPPASPGDQGALPGLWTVRATHHWREWPALGRAAFTALPPHRRRYLTWQGTLTGGRGHVYTAGTGHVEVLRWTALQIELILRPDRGPSLAIAMRQLGPTPRWAAVFSA